MADKAQWKAGTTRKDHGKSWQALDKKMANLNTKIEWCDATWNVVTGCSKVSQGCKNCYAERIFQRPYPGRDFTDVRCHPDRLTQPLRWRKPRRIFVNSMADLFHERVPEDFLTKAFSVMALSGQHTFQVLTKRPERALDYVSKLSKSIAPLETAAREIGYTFKFTGFDGRDYSTLPWPIRNVWIGVSVENQETWEERSTVLKRVPAVVHFISYEPALGPLGDIDLSGIDWVIAGGESGTHARPSHPQWFRDVRDQCQAAGVPFFMKQWGEWLPYDQASVKQRSIPCLSCLTLAGDGRSGQPGYWIKFGKHRAGRLLDGREWNEFPE